jgi:hypothetical protein
MDEFSKKLVIGVTRAMFNHLYGSKYQTHNQCLRWAGLTAYVYNQLAGSSKYAIIQAGSAQWKYKDGPDEADCYFGYTYNVAEMERRVLDPSDAGMNIEWHVWVGVPKTEEVIDITTAYQSHQMATTAINLPRNTPWEPKHALPDYIWLRGQDAFDKGWQYLANMSACLIAHSTFSHALQVHDLVSKSDLSRLFKHCVMNHNP